MEKRPYDEQLKQAWSTGEYAAGAPWTAPSAQAGTEQPAALRGELRRAMERIVEGEAESLGEGRRMEGKMKLAKFVKFREEKFGGVLFETRSEKVYTLNPTGAALVREIVGGAPCVVTALKERYDDKTGAMELEAKAFLADLQTKGLVE